MTTEQTLVFLKPDALANGENVATIIERITAAGFQIVRCKLTDVTDAKILEHYDHLVKSFGDAMREKILKYFSGTRVFVLLLERENAILAMRELVGATDPVKAGVGTIRGDLSKDDLQVAMREGRFVNNLIHASDSLESATREAAIWLS